jgi:hypothetical protein
MERPLADKRPIGPLTDRLYSDSNSKGVLMARKQGNPELRMEIAEVNTGIDEQIFETFNKRAKFEAQDIIVGREEGQVGTVEPAVTTIQIIAEDKQVDFEDMTHIVEVMRREFTVFETNIAASVGVDPDKVPNPLEGTELIEEPTEVER